MLTWFKGGKCQSVKRLTSYWEGVSQMDQLKWAKDPKWTKQDELRILSCLTLEIAIRCYELVSVLYFFLLIFLKEQRILEKKLRLKYMDKRRKPEVLSVSFYWIWECLRWSLLHWINLYWTDVLSILLDSYFPLLEQVFNALLGIKFSFLKLFSFSFLLKRFWYFIAPIKCL